MKTINEEAIRQMATLEEGVSVTAGVVDTEAFYRRVEQQRAISQQTASAFSSVLGLFLNMARRERSLSLEQLAGEIDSNAMELFLIEEGKKTPEPRLVFRLAGALNVSPGRLMQIAGHAQVLDHEVAAAAYTFATRAHSKPLEPEEREALHEFVKALASS